jgi:hypothetical protein
LSTYHALLGSLQLFLGVRKVLLVGLLIGSFGLDNCGLLSGGRIGSCNVGHGGIISSRAVKSSGKVESVDWILESVVYRFESAHRERRKGGKAWR